MENKDTGILLSENNIKLHRMWFQQMTKLLGLNVQYRAPREESKQYNLYGELESHFYEPIEVACIFDEHPTQKTMQKLGWNVELSDTSVLIHVPYDLPKLAAGALFIIPAGLDHAEPRMFRVLRMSNIAIYPASIICELGLVYRDTLPKSQTVDFSKTNFNLLDDESDEYNH